MKKLIPLIFFGNYFYGLCAVALSIEAGLQQHLLLSDFKFYLLLFFATVWFYNKAYLKDEYLDATTNERSKWYQQNYYVIKQIQIVFFLLLLFLFVLIVTPLSISKINFTQICLATIFPIAGVFYYGLENNFFPKIQIRKIGWLKPFIIGFCWAGAVTIYPAIYYQLTHNKPYSLEMFTCLLFIKNFMFVSVLSILFDIKDYATDFNHQVKTFVVNFGIRKTLYFIILPLTTFGFLSFLISAFIQNFSVLKISFNLLPFIAILFVSYSLQRRKSIIFYLFVIDGILLLKAVCGSIAMLYF